MPCIALNAYSCYAGKHIEQSFPLPTIITDESHLSIVHFDDDDDDDEGWGRTRPVFFVFAKWCKLDVNWCMYKSTRSNASKHVPSNGFLHNSSQNVASHCSWMAIDRSETRDDWEIGGISLPEMNYESIFNATHTGRPALGRFVSLCRVVNRVGPLTSERSARTGPVLNSAQRSFDVNLRVTFAINHSSFLFSSFFSHNNHLSLQPHSPVVNQLHLHRALSL